MSITEEIILQHAKNSPVRGRIKSPNLTAKLKNIMCGDEIRVDINVEKEKIVDIAFSGTGCLISQASASLIITEAKKVKKISRIKEFNQDAVLKLLGVKLTCSRIKCAILGLRVLQKALAIN